MIYRIKVFVLPCCSSERLKVPLGNDIIHIIIGVEGHCRATDHVDWRDQTGIGNGCEHRCNEANGRWGCLRSVRFACIPLWGSGVSRTPGTLLDKRAVFPTAGTFASLFFKSLGEGLTGIAARGDLDCFPSWLNRHSLPLVHRPCFQNLQICFFLFLPVLSLDGDLPLSDEGLDWLRSFFGGGFSCLYVQE